MRILKRGIYFSCTALSLTFAETGEIRTWSSANGQATFSGSVVQIVSGKVILDNGQGKEVTVPIAKLSQADRDYLSAYQQERKSEQRAAERKVDLPYKQGEVVGPIRAKSSSHYYLYLPESLTSTRKAPLLFYTHSSRPQDARLIEELITAAEINGWVMALSVESCNDNGTSANLDTANKAVDHILDTLPVDKKRLYFTGNSGGGAMCMINGADMRACGLMPNVGYLPSSAGKPKCDVFVINGGTDYNRYTSADMRKKIGKTAVHRFHGGGHGKAPAWLFQDGMLWLEGRYLAEKGDKAAGERDDYIEALTAWINANTIREPHRAYYWAVFMKKQLNCSPAQNAALDAVISELGQAPENALYVEGLADIDNLSLNKLSKYGQGSLYDHSNGAVESECEKLLRKYEGVPVIEDALKAIGSPTPPKPSYAY
ncbi:hypothetical protein EGM51_06180 [Verrucomicrobia bacterium S94]|nr:hypothetical protein EGM51_06180 [Verrucomicrobia bacterium S94]